VSPLAHREWFRLRRGASLRVWRPGMASADADSLLCLALPGKHPNGVPGPIEVPAGLDAVRVTKPTDLRDALAGPGQARGPPWSTW